jgi:hypothetical protein
MSEGERQDQNPQAQIPYDGEIGAVASHAARMEAAIPRAASYEMRLCNMIRLTRPYRPAAGLLT